MAVGATVVTAAGCVVVASVLGDAVGAGAVATLVAIGASVVAVAMSSSSLQAPTVNTAHAARQSARTTERPPGTGSTLLVMPV